MAAIVGQEHRVVRRDVDAVGARISTLAPGVPEIAGAVEDDHRVLAAVEHIDVVVAVDADPADLLEGPAVGQFRPVGIDPVFELAASDDHRRVPSRAYRSIAGSPFGPPRQELRDISTPFVPASAECDRTRGQRARGEPRQS
jgi:hypothetical protein